jgi:Cft2 family RNA processing exonuclease
MYDTRVCRYVHYHDADRNTDQRCQSSAVPEELKKKVSLLSYFARYMNTYLSMSERGNSPQYTDVADEPATVAVKKWHRTKNTVVMYLSNGTLQVTILLYFKVFVLAFKHQSLIPVFLKRTNNLIQYDFYAGEFT